MAELWLGFGRVGSPCRERENPGRAGLRVGGEVLEGLGLQGLRDVQGLLDFSSAPWTPCRCGHPATDSSADLPLLSHPPLPPHLALWGHLW